jgi:hypothetical protein
MTDTPRITLRQEDIDEMFRDCPVRELKIWVAEQDWRPFLDVAYDGMEIPVAVEGSAEQLTSVLVGVDHAAQAITVVI